MELPFRAKRVDLPARDGGRCARAFVEAEVVAVSRRVVKLPDGASGSSVQRLDGFPFPQAMKKNEASLGHDRSAEALADVSLPNQRRPAFRPGLCEIIARVDATTLRAE